MLLNVRLGYLFSVSVMLFLEQSVMFILYLIIVSVKNYEIFLVKLDWRIFHLQLESSHYLFGSMRYVRFNLLYLRRLRTRAEPDKS